MDKNFIASSFKKKKDVTNNSDTNNQKNKDIDEFISD
jgi:hypothetical protein